MYRHGDRHYEGYPKPELVDVKTEVEWRKHWRQWRPKLKAAYRCAKEYGTVFRIYDESRIHDQALENSMFLKRYEHMSFPPEEGAWVLNNLREMGMATVDYLLTRHFMGRLYRAEGIAHLWHLLGTNRMVCDLSRPLSMFTEVWIPEI